MYQFTSPSPDETISLVFEEHLEFIYTVRTILAAHLEPTTLATSNTEHGSFNFIIVKPKITV